jgi:hypothetical protein
VLKMYRSDKRKHRTLSAKGKMIKKLYVRSEVFTAVTMKNAVFWDVALCRYFVNRRFGGTYRLHLQSIRNPREMN